MELDQQKPVIQVARAAELTLEVAAKATAAVGELQRASEMATMVARVATAVAQSPNVAELADAVLDQTVDALGASACSFFRADPHRRELHLASSRRLPPDFVEQISRVSFDSSLLPARAMRSRALQVVDDLDEIANEPRAITEFLARIGTQRIICAPLIAANEVVGVLIYVHTESHALSADDLAVIEVIASIVGIGLSNALAQERLSHERARLHTIVENAPNGVVHLDLLERTQTANPAAERLVGLSITGPLTERSPNPLFRPDGRPLPDREDPGQRARRGETVSQEEVLVEVPGGQRRPMLVSAAPVVNEHGGVIGVVITFEDISVLKELDRLREEFAAIVAHDLRNPISAILMTAEMMLAKTNGENKLLVQTTGVERIRHSAARLGMMVNDLLDASRIEIGRLALDRKVVDAADTVASLVSHIQPTLGDHVVELDTEGGHVCVTLDPLRFEQILTNVVENAAKYSADGAPIVVRVQGHKHGVEFSVIDKGRGIPPSELPLLFDRFYQAKRARAMRKGLGLGLYITKGLVEAHGGKITVESEPGRGSTFHIWLPFTPPETPPAAEAA